jgi:ABC-type nitrate/sulfonate/bicarbonate transport system substrate-binding protein
LKSPRTLLAALAVVAVATTACTGGGASPTPAGATPAASTGPQPSTGAEPTGAAGPGAPETTTLRVAFSGQPDFTQVANFRWLDELKAKHGIDAEPLIFEGTDPPFRAVISGDADMVVGQVPPGIKLVLEASEDLQMIGADVAASDYLLVSTSDINTPTDLYGKKVGTAGAGAVSDSLTLAALKRQGIDTSQIEFVQIGGTGARMAALLSNQVSAGAAHAAEGYDAVSKGLNELLPIGEALGPYLFHGVWAKKTWLDANPNLAQIAIDEFMESVRWAAGNKDDYIAIAKTKVEGLSDDAMSKAYDLFLRIKLFAVNGGLEPATVDATIALEQEVGGLPADIPPTDQWLNDTFVQSYLERNGSQ